MNKIFFSIMLLGCLTACEDYLEIPPASQLAPENLYNSEKGIELGVNGVYHQLREATMAGSYNHWLLTEVPADNMLTHSDKEYRQSLDKYLFTSSNEVVLEQWKNYYSTLGVANAFIVHAENSKVDNLELKERVIAEAKCLRAYVYFMLVRLWGDVPLIITETSSDGNYFVSRTAKEEVYQQIIADLEYAELKLPWSYSKAEDAGRFTCGAAKSLLSKVYLTQGNFGAAASKSYEVIVSDQYSLHDNYLNLFRPEGNKSLESIFQIQAITNYAGLNSSMGRYWSPRINLAGHQGSDQYTASWQLYDLFQEGDERKTTFVIAKNQNSGKDLPYTTKYVDPGAETEKLYGTSFHVIRFAEVLLTYAEAENEVNGPSAEAYISINKIRSRAGLSNLTEGLDMNGFRDSLMLERRKELYFEGERWFDLIRTGKLKEAVESVPAGVNADYYPTVEIPRHLLFPVPAIETEINEKLLPNNPGW